MLAGKLIAATSAGTSLNYITSVLDNTSLTTYNFDSVSVGDPHPTREVFVVVRWSNTTTRSLSSATIGGSSATIATTQLNSSNFGMAVIFASATSSATTRDIDLTFSGAVSNAMIFVYRVTNRTNRGNNQVASYGDTGAVTRSSYNLANVVVPQNGFLLLNFTSGQATDLTLSSTNLTIDADLYPASAQNRASLSRTNFWKSQETITANITWGGASVGCGVRMWTFN